MLTIYQTMPLFSEIKYHIPEHSGTDSANSAFPFRFHDSTISAPLMVRYHYQIKLLEEPINAIFSIVRSDRGHQPSSACNFGTRRWLAAYADTVTRSSHAPEPPPSDRIISTYQIHVFQADIGRRNQFHTPGAHILYPFPPRQPSVVPAPVTRQAARSPVPFKLIFSPRHTALMLSETLNPLAPIVDPHSH